MDNIKYTKVPVNKFMGVYKEIKNVIDCKYYVIDSTVPNMLDNHISFLNNKINDLHLQHNKDINTLKQKFNNKIDSLKNIQFSNLKQLENDILNLKNNNLELKNQLDNYKKLNDNLLRICKERANQKRGLSPKKSHSGFIVLNRKSTFYKFISKTGKKTNSIEFECFKVNIQTPFDSSISLNLIKQDIINSFINIMNNFGISNWYDYSVIKDYSIIDFVSIFNETDENFIFKHSFIANNKSNLWEIEIYTKKDIVN